ncbi:hypothetical protein Cgig2_015412 [Carnegiea gigantea]|uniref:DUF8040 domain-containing protein n=1 Tax=Carnegiea gigantea TaxID=171969 RepID=A0A9Q1K366_9CARY|nr:hypothetical protein Cgig2_015412 [Carnegiea gigantea]
MNPMAFFKLCETLEGKRLLASIMNMSIKEQILMSLHLVGHNVRFRAIRGRFFLLQAILKLYLEFVNSSNSSTPVKILNNSSGIDPNNQIMREVDLEFSSNTHRKRMSQREEREENQAWIVPVIIWKKRKMKEVNKEKETQFRWLKLMLKKLLAFLASEIQKENRPNNSFKSSSYVAAVNAISKKFNVRCLPEHINNHLKTVKMHGLSQRQRIWFWVG